MPAKRASKPVNVLGSVKLIRLLPSCFLSLALLAIGDLRAENDRAKDELPPPHTAYYHLYKGIVVLAKTRRTFRVAKNNHYVFMSYTEPTGVGRMLTGATIKERSYWTLKDNYPKPLEYSYINSGGDKDRDVKLIFDWEQNKVTNIINGDPWTMDLVPRIQDKLLYQFSLMLELKKGVTQFSYDVADGGKLKNYSGKVVGQDVVETDLGKFDTVVVLREHDGKQTRFWCAKSMHYIPVQIEQSNREGSSVTAKLYQIEGVKIPVFNESE